ncbi:MAG: beta-galactosidase [Promethearchaeota archaeon]
MPALRFRVDENWLPKAETLFGMSGQDKEGNKLRVTNYYLEYNNRALLPVMAEFHFSRYPPEYWRESLLKIKACAVNIIATYVYWIHHEEVRGEFRWDGQRDLRRFVKICKDVGLWCFLRIGPFAHGECRNGGLPDWIWNEPYKRTDDVRFLEPVQQYFYQIYKQIEGLLFKNGGPIIGIQIENEYQAGKKGIPYIRALKDIAKKIGFDVPLWTVTGWGKDATIPENEFIPVFGAYPAMPWVMHVKPLNTIASTGYFFLPDFIEDPSLEKDLPAIQDENHEHVPRFTCEVGAGNQVTYHRRPIINTKDVLAIAISMLGSGVNLLGYYMFHGGTNPDGFTTTMQETLGRPSMLEYPVYSYDFQAPLSEFGSPRESYHEYRLLHLFINEQSGMLARSKTYFPRPFPKNLNDAKTPRAALRFGKEGGFFFFNNHDRYNKKMDEIKDWLAWIEGSSFKLKVPETPITIPRGAYGAWPIKIRVGSLKIIHSTYQIITALKLDAKEKGSKTSTVCVFFREIPGIPGELMLDVDGLLVEKHEPAKELQHGKYCSFVNLGHGIKKPALVVDEKNMPRTFVYILDPEISRGFWKARLARGEHALLTGTNLYWDENIITLYGRDPEKFDLITCPPLGDISVSCDFQKEELNELFMKYKFNLDFKLKIDLIWEKEASDSEISWKTKIPVDCFKRVNDLFLIVTFVGNQIRLKINGRLAWDDYYCGKPAEIGLKRWQQELEQGAEICICVTVLEIDDDIYFDLPDSTEFPSGIQETCRIEKIEAIPEYKLDVMVE